MMICLFASSILPLPHLSSSPGFCGRGGGVFGFKSSSGLLFSYRTHWSTVPEASAANIIQGQGNFAFKFLTSETHDEIQRNIDWSYDMICKRMANVSLLDL